MATEVIAFPVNLRMNQNKFNHGYKKYYPEADAKEPLSLRGFAKHMVSHGKLTDYPMVVLVLQNIVSCLKELVTQGQPVKLNGLGTFEPTIEGDGDKVVDSVEKSLEVGIDNLIAGVHMRFTPENTKGEKLTSRALKAECTFKGAYVITRKSKVIDGKKRYYQEKIPISSFMVATADADPDGNG